MCKTITIDDLTRSTNNTHGWPWTNAYTELPEKMADGYDWPKISIVTPSYNQGEFIEETIRSVLLQGYPNLEYIIIDGGSTDNTVDIIKKYEQYISYWVSEPDGGQSHALNKGFRKATGDLIGWQNSDDYYSREAFKRVAEASRIYQDTDIFYGQVEILDLKKKVKSIVGTPMFSLEQNLPWFCWCNQSMFFRRKIFQEGYYINEKYNYYMDYEFWWKLILAGYKFQFIPEIKGYLRNQPNSKAHHQDDQWSQELLETYKIPYFSKNQKIVTNSLRQKLLEASKGVCLDNFRRLRLQIFRHQVQEIISMSGWMLKDTDLYFKYLASFFGQKTLKETQKIRIYFNLLTRDQA
jgi:glycosyltransferase involved in cell wall biosynthesis